MAGFRYYQLWYFICHSLLMKNNTIIIVFVLAFGMAARCQPGKHVNQIELSKMSRGYEERIHLTADSLHVWIENNRGEKPRVERTRKLTAQEWTSLINLTNEIKLTDFSALPSPTMKRATDAAMHSTITIHLADGRTYSHGYDDEDPHDIAKPLLKKIREISNSEEKP